jgi:hypothetical protein
MKFEDLKSVKKKQYDDSSNCSEHSAATGNYFAVTL